MESVRSSGETVEVRVGSRNVAIIDKCDESLVSGICWSLVVREKCRYAQSVSPMSGVSHMLMHRLIIGAKAGCDIDHINGNGLDNRRCNLRICSRSQNLWNSRKHFAGTSRYKGVHWCKTNKRWVAKIRVYGKRIHGGMFAEEDAAARCYDRLAKEHFGEYAKLNFTN